MKTKQELEEAAFSTDDVQVLQDLVMSGIERIEQLEAHLYGVKACPKRNKDLAHAIQAFAEWQTPGYNVDSRTHAIVARQLWSEVSEHVRDIIGKSTQDVGFVADKLAPRSAGAVDGISGSGSAEQARFVFG